MKSKGGDSGGGNGVSARGRKPLLMAWRGSAAWRYLLLVGIVVASPGFARSDTLHFAIAPAITGVLITGIGATSLFSSDLNGTVVAGQSLSLDLVFNDGELARLFLIDPQTFGIELIIYTNAGFLKNVASKCIWSMRGTRRTCRGGRAMYRRANGC